MKNISCLFLLMSLIANCQSDNESCSKIQFFKRSELAKIFSKLESEDFTNLYFQSNDIHDLKKHQANNTFTFLLSGLSTKFLQTIVSIEKFEYTVETNFLIQKTSKIRNKDHLENEI